MQLIKNGDFESGALEPGWRAVPGTQTEASVTNNQALNGNYSLELKGWDFVGQSLLAYGITSDLIFWLLQPSPMHSFQP